MPALFLSSRSGDAWRLPSTPTAALPSICSPTGHSSNRTRTCPCSRLSLRYTRVCWSHLMQTNTWSHPPSHACLSSLHIYGAVHLVDVLHLILAFHFYYALYITGIYARLYAHYLSAPYLYYSPYPLLDSPFTVHVLCPSCHTFLLFCPTVSILQSTQVLVLQWRKVTYIHVLNRFADDYFYSYRWFILINT